MKINTKLQVPISLVCTTFNRPISLFKLLNSIQKNLYKPNEVIIVGTNILDFKLINDKNFNFKIIKLISPIKNQIYQRNLGLKKISNLLVIQSDDDLVYEREFFKNFYNHFRINQNQKKIVGAKILTFNNKNQSNRWNEIYRKNIFFRVILRILNNFKKVQPMSILSSGRIVPLLPEKLREKSKNILRNAQWLSSTCCYNFKQISKLNTYNKIFSKKSYYEDVIFTHNQFKNGFELVIDGKIMCYHPFIHPTDFKVYKETVKNQWLIVKIFKKSKFLFLIDIVIFSILFLLKDFFKIFKK